MEIAFGDFHDSFSPGEAIFRPSGAEGDSRIALTNMIISKNTADAFASAVLDILHYAFCILHSALYFSPLG